MALVLRTYILSISPSFSCRIFSWSSLDSSWISDPPCVLALKRENWEDLCQSVRIGKNRRPMEHCFGQSTSTLSSRERHQELSCNKKLRTNLHSILWQNITLVLPKPRLGIYGFLQQSLLSETVAYLMQTTLCCTTLCVQQIVHNRFRFGWKDSRLCGLHCPFWMMVT